MPRTVLFLALLALLAPSRLVLAGPPKKASARVASDDVPALRATVQRLERQLASGKAQPTHAEDLAEARARLAEAEGRTGTAACEWRRVLASRRTNLADVERLVKTGRWCGSALELVLVHGRVAEARCKVAEIEGDQAALGAGLPEVVAYYGASLERLQKLRQVGAINTQEASALERDLRRKLGKARSRLKTISKAVPPKGSVSGTRPQSKTSVVGGHQ